MRLTLGRLLVRSPLPGTGELMRAVMECSEQVPKLIEALIQGDQPLIYELARQASRLEGVADSAKNQVRERMPLRLFLPVDRRDLLRLLSEIDAIADCAEDVGVLLTIREMEVPPEPMRPLLTSFVEKTMETVKTSARLVATLDALLEASFTGRTVKQAHEIIDELHRCEHEADKVQDQIAKVLFQHERQLPPVAIFMWTKILNKIGDMANHAENVGDQFRLLIAQ